MIKNLLILYWIRAIIAFRARTASAWSEDVKNVFGCEVKYFMNPAYSGGGDCICIAEFVLDGKLIEMGCVVNSFGFVTERFIGSWDKWEKINEDTDPRCLVKNPSPYWYKFDTGLRKQNQTTIFNIAKKVETPKLSLS